LIREEKQTGEKNNPGFVTNSKTGRGIARGLLPALSLGSCYLATAHQPEKLYQQGPTALIQELYP
jgi:hypothetical protein